MTLNFRGADKQIVILKDGNTYDKNNFAVFFNSIQRVHLKISSNRVADFEITVAPSLADGLKILQTGVLSVMTGFAAKLEQTTQVKKETAISPSFAQTQLEVSESADAKTLHDKNIPVFLIKLLWPGDKLPDGNEAETPWFTGSALNPDVSFDAKSFIFTIKGVSTASRVSGIYGTNVYKNMTIRDILEDIDNTMTFVSDDDETTARLNSKTSFAYNDSTEEAIARLLYESNILYHTYGNPKTYFLRNRESVYTSRPVYQFVAFRQIDPNKNIYPIFSYSCEGLGRLFTGGLALGVLPKAYDMSKKELVTKAYSPSLSDEAITFIEKQKDTASQQGGVTISQPTRVDTQGAQGSDKTPQDSRAENTALEAMQSYLNCTITTIGIPDILPNTMVDVRIGDDSTGNGLPGVSGKGMVTTVEHEYSMSGWLTTLNVRIGASIGSTEYKGIPEFSSSSSSSSQTKPTIPRNIK